MRLVLDTNIVMDMLHFADRHTLPVHQLINNRQMQCFTDSACLAELERVTAYPEFSLDATSRLVLMETYQQMVSKCEADGDEDFVLPRCRDQDDQKFLILAARCKADMLITRDKLLLRLAGHRHKPPPFGIMTAQAANTLLGLG